MLIGWPPTHRLGRTWTTDYVKLLRNTLDQADLQHIKIVVADNSISSEDEIAEAK